MCFGLRESGRGFCGRPKATSLPKLKSEGDGRYRVRDFWSWHRGFEIFREQYAEDFARFDREIVEELVEKQEFVGAFYEADGTNFEIM